ncbi:MAG: NAD(P)H-binding protein, partial [Vicinamibacteria bacterium]
MSEMIVVMGASGHVGGEVARRLLAAGRTVRAIARSADKLRALKGADVKTGSLGDKTFLTGAVRGATTVFAMLPPDYAAADMHASQKAVAESIAASIQEAGVTHVVALSSIGAELSAGTGPIAHLHAFEALLNGVPGLNVVHVRAAYFMENLLNNIGLIKSAGVNGATVKADRPIAMTATR